MRRIAFVIIICLMAVCITYFAGAEEPEPVVIDDFEVGVGQWSKSVGPKGEVSIAINNDSQVGKKSADIMLDSGGAGSWGVIALWNINYDKHTLALLDPAYENFTFWVKGIEGIGSAPITVIIQEVINDPKQEYRWSTTFKLPSEEWEKIVIPIADFKPKVGNKPLKELKMMTGFFFSEEPGVQPAVRFLVDGIQIEGPVEEMNKSVDQKGKLITLWAAVKSRLY